jgi:hypothetical protein
MDHLSKLSGIIEDPNDRVSSLSRSPQSIIQQLLFKDKNYKNAHQISSILKARESILLLFFYYDASNTAVVILCVCVD